MYPLVVPKLAAAAIGLGIGVAVFAGAGAAVAAPSDSDSGSSSSAASDSSAATETRESKSADDDDTSQKSRRQASKTDGGPRNSDQADDESDDADAEGSVEGDEPAGDDTPADEDDATADEDDALAEDEDTEGAEEPVVEATATVDVDQAAVATPRPLKEPTRSQIGMDRLLAGFARALGYAPVDADHPAPPMTPLRTWWGNTLAALRKANDDNPANEIPTAKPVKLYEFVTGEQVGDLRAVDVDGDGLTFEVLDGPAHGSLVVNANGTYYYKPNAEFSETGGIETFYVSVNDGNQNKAVVPVTVTVNPTLGVSRHFWFRNYTLAPLLFHGYANGTDDLDGGPALNTVLNPGVQAQWDVTVYFFVKGNLTPQFGSVGYGRTPSDPGYIPESVVWGTIQPTFTTDGSTWQSNCHSGGSIRCDNLGTTVIAQNNATVTLTGDEANKIAAVLTTICLDGSDAVCSFDAKSQVAGYAAEKQQGVAVKNSSQDNMNTTITITDIASQTDTVGVSVKMSGGQLTKLASLINLEITTTYQHAWTETHQFAQSVALTIRPGQTGWVQGGAPVWRVTGDFTVKLGWSTFVLKGATFDTPNPNGVKTYVGCTTDGGDPGCKLG